jgi:hypothetical protein
MKCRICGCDLDEECVYDEIDFDIAFTWREKLGMLELPV